MEMKKVLIVWNSNNRVEHRDCDGVQKALEDHGIYVEQIRLSHMYKKYYEIDVNSFDMILFKPWFNAMFASGGNAWDLSERIKSEYKGKIGIIYCDIKMKFTSNVLKHTEDGYLKKNFFEGMDAEILYSLDDSVLENREFMKSLYERTSDFKMPIIPFEWNFMTFSLYDELSSSVDKDCELEFSKCYWGQNKPKVKKSLDLMEFGKVNDIAIGPIATKYPNCIQILPDKKGTTIPFEEYVTKSRYILIPYEEIKSEHQFTLRFVEAIALMNNKSEIVFDPRVSDYLRKFNSKESIKEKYNNVCNEFIEEYLTC